MLYNLNARLSHHAGGAYCTRSPETLLHNGSDAPAAVHGKDPPIGRSFPS